MNKFEDTIKQLQENVEELKAYCQEKVEEAQSEEVKAKISEVVNRTIDAINASIEKIKAVINDVKDDQKLDEFFDKIVAKSQEAVDYTKGKIEALFTENNKTLEDLHKDVMDEFDKIKENDTVRKAAEYLKEVDNKINEFFQKPEVKESINKAKVTTINVAQAGVDGLKKVLKPEEIKKEDKPQD